jgi:molybdenum cofactor guanylyltransferase
VKVDGVILAGGKGTRFNFTNKGLLTIQNKPFVFILQTEFQDSLDRIYINTNTDLKAYKKLGLHPIVDEKQGFLGPLYGIFTILNITTADYLFVMPVDSPFLKRNILVLLKKKAVRNPNSIICVTDGKRKQPLIALIPTNLKISLANYLKNNNKKVFSWVDLHKPIWCNLKNHKEQLRNINKPLDLI